MRIQIYTTILIASALAASSSSRSLWDSASNSERSMFADRTASEIGDILMIQVEEETTANRSSTKQYAKTTDTFKQALGTILIPGLVDTTNDAEKWTVDLPTTTYSGNGGGTVTETTIMQSKIAVMVVDVLPNGNLVVEGARKIKATGEAQYLVVRGIVRADDVPSSNTIMSTQVLNANAELFNEGDIRKSQDKNWIKRIISTANLM